MDTLLMALVAIGTLLAAFWLDGVRWFVRAALLLISALLFFVLHQRHADTFWILIIVVLGLAVGSLLVILLRRTDPARRHPDTRRADRQPLFRTCPGCGETIEREAVPCPLCGHVPSEHPTAQGVSRDGRAADDLAADDTVVQESRPDGSHLHLIQ